MADLSIQLRTGYSPGDDFSAIELLVYRADKPWKKPQHLIGHPPDDVSADDYTSVFYVRKVRKNRNNIVYMRLLDHRGSSIAHFTMHVRPSSSRQFVRFAFDRR
jgi:hypothetical protein